MLPARELLLMGWVVLVAGLVLAFANGANDNMKGVATLYGSGSLSYRACLAVATLSTAVGSLSCVIVAPKLVAAFSAKGLVPDAALTPAFLAAVALAAALTVLAATWMGLPISTTHALIGGLVGAGFVAAGPQLALSSLGSVFLLPLLLSPIASVGLAAGIYLAGRTVRRRTGIEAETGLYIQQTAIAAPAGELRARYVGSIMGISAHAIVTTAHVASASLVGLARGFNDTPKILGLLVGSAVLTPASGAVAITVMMGAGGLIASGRVAETLARKITPMNEGQGLAGNFATSFLVVAASRLGLPVSTTHVATGSIFGVGLAANEARWAAIHPILLAWVATLPLGALLAAILISLPWS